MTPRWLTGVQPYPLLFSGLGRKPRPLVLLAVFVVQRFQRSASHLLKRAGSCFDVVRPAPHSFFISKHVVFMFFLRSVRGFFTRRLQAGHTGGPPDVEVLRRCIKVENPFLITLKDSSHFAL